MGIAANAVGMYPTLLKVQGIELMIVTHNVYHPEPAQSNW